MSVIRVHKNKNFTVMSNTHLFDKNLSLKAAGLLSKILALPDNWNYSIKGLCAICKENETAVKNALNELRDNRYVIVERIEPSKETGGRIQYEYFVYEQPQGEENKKIDVKDAYRVKQEQENQCKEKQGIENLGVECLQVENKGDILNTNISSINKTNTDTVNTYGLNTDNNSLSNDKDNSKSKDLELYNSPVPEKQESHISMSIGVKQKQSREKPLKDMPTRAKEIAESIVGDSGLSDGVRDCVSYFLCKYAAKNHKEHIPLKNDTLQDVVEVMLSSITIQHDKDVENEYQTVFYPLVFDMTDWDDRKKVIDQYFETKFNYTDGSGNQIKVDYSLVHFTQKEVITHVMQKCYIGDDYSWYESEPVN